MHEDPELQFLVKAHWNLLGRAPGDDELHDALGALRAGRSRGAHLALLRGLPEVCKRQLASAAAEVHDGVPFRVVRGSSRLLLVTYPGIGLPGRPPSSPYDQVAAHHSQLQIGIGAAMPRSPGDIRAWARSVGSLVDDVAQRLGLEGSGIVSAGHSFAGTHAVLVALASSCRRIVVGAPAVRLGFWVAALKASTTWRSNMAPLFDYLYEGATAGNAGALTELDGLVYEALAKSAQATWSVFVSDADDFHVDAQLLLDRLQQRTDEVNVAYSNYKGHERVASYFEEHLCRLLHDLESSI